MDQVRLGHCVGCYSCWLKTSGLCVQKDAGIEIARSILSSNLTIFFSPVVFGGYSPGLKRLVDRLLSPMNLPYMAARDGETHHLPRYPHSPRLVGIGVQTSPDLLTAEIFKTLVGRNAVQIHAPSYAAAVVRAAEPADILRQKFRALLTQNDPFPRARALQDLYLRAELPLPGTPRRAEDPDRRVLLLAGSQRPNTAPQWLWANTC